MTAWAVLQEKDGPKKRNQKNSGKPLIIFFMLTHTHCVSKKFTRMACYELDIHEPILIIFGKNVTEKVSHEKMLNFSTSPN